VLKLTVSHPQSYGLHCPTENLLMFIMNRNRKVCMSFFRRKVQIISSRNEEDLTELKTGGKGASIYLEQLVTSK